MAVRDLNIEELKTFRDDAHVASWEGLTNATSDSGEPLEMPGSADRSVQVIGTFGSGGTCVIEGSNDGVNYSTLTDYQGNALSIQSATIDSISEITRYIRPRISAGDGATDLDVFILVRRLGR